MAGKPHTLYAHVWNLGLAPLVGISVEFLVFNPSIAFGFFLAARVQPVLESIDVLEGLEQVLAYGRNHPIDQSRLSGVLRNPLSDAAGLFRCELEDFLRRSFGLARLLARFR